MPALPHWLAVALCLGVPACATVPSKPRPDPVATAQAFQSRQLQNVLPDLPPAASGWDRAQWLQASLALNPQLAEARARATAVAAGERTAAQRPNPTLNLFDEYVTAAAGGAAWLYGLSVDFLLQRPGERSRARQAAALQTQAAQSDLAESLWQVRAQLRQGLLDVVSTSDEIALLRQLLEDHEGMLASANARARAGETGVTEIAPAILERAAVQQRLDQALAREADARGRLAAAVGVPVSALDGVSLSWPQWADIAALSLSPSQLNAWRLEALIARPDIVRTLREYDLADNALRAEVARRWPAIHVEPGYAWDRGGVHENQLNENLRDNELGLSLELPLFNRNEGPIGEALARRELAGRHLEASQAELFGQIERAESAWPRAHQARQNARASAETAQRQNQAEQRALAAGASDRPSALLAAAAAREAQLLSLRAAYEAQQAFAALEDAYRRPLEGPECALPLSWRTE
jgi:outer membrane protein, heavy metal efflux system